MVPKCTCDFGGEDVVVEEQAGGNEMLAGTVGALGSTLVSGGGFGAWMLFRARANVAPEVGDEESSERKAPPGSNVYRSGQNDPHIHRAAAV